MSILKTIRAHIKGDVLPRRLLDDALGDKSSDAKKALLKRACQSGVLLRLRKGLYVLGDDYKQSPYNLYEIANLMIEPSYVSLESALSFYGLIPEAVYTTTSVTTKNSLIHQTSLGLFEFSRLKMTHFNFGFYRIKETHHSYLMATPLKALMDTLVLRKKAYKL